MNAKHIDWIRRIAAATLIIGLSGMVARLYSGGSNLKAENEYYAAFLVVAAVGFFAVIFLIVEHFIRSLFEMRAKGLAKYQFSLLELFAATTLLAVLLSGYKIFGDAFWPVLIGVLLLLGCTVEVHRRRSGAAKPPAATDPGSDFETSSTANSADGSVRDRGNQ